MYKDYRTGESIDKGLLIHNIEFNYCEDCSGQEDKFLCQSCRTADILDIIEMSKAEKKSNGLPCKIGDIMWCIKNQSGKLTAQSGIVNEMFYKDDMTLMIVIKYVGRGLYGEKIFRTQEDCLNKIKELNEEETSGYEL